MDHTAVLRTTRTTLCPITLPPAGQHDIPPPPELAEGKELHRLWHVRRQDGQPLGWVWLHDANETLHDITLSFRAVSEDTDALLEAVLKARCTLAGDPAVRVVTTATEDAKLVDGLRRCGFTLARMDGECFVLEYVMQSSRRFPLYLGIAAVLSVLLYLLLHSWMSAACVGFCLALAGGYLHEHSQRRHFLRQRAEQLLSGRST